MDHGHGSRDGGDRPRQKGGAPKRGGRLVPLDAAARQGVWPYPGFEDAGAWHTAGQPGALWRTARLTAVAIAPLALSDPQLEIVLAMARPLAPEDRPGFLEAVAQALAGIPEVGDGAVARACCAAQRIYWRAPIEA